MWRACACGMWLMHSQLGGRLMRRACAFGVRLMLPRIECWACGRSALHLVLPVVCTRFPAACTLTQHVPFLLTDASL